MAGAAGRAGAARQQQAAILDRAVGLLSPGGRIAYITCSVLDAENGAQVRAFLTRHPEFAATPPAVVVQALGESATAFSEAVLTSEEGLLMTPRRTGPMDSTCRSWRKLPHPEERSARPGSPRRLQRLLVSRALPCSAPQPEVAMRAFAPLRFRGLGRLRLPRSDRRGVGFDLPAAALCRVAFVPGQVAEERPARNVAEAHVEDGRASASLPSLSAKPQCARCQFSAVKPIFDVFGSSENCDSVKKVRPIATP